MKFLIDAQLPRRVASWLTDLGHDALHTLDLPLGNSTPDSQIICVADREDRIVVTKDGDFVQSLLIKDEPRRPLLISTGNVSNAELAILLQLNIETIVQSFEQYRLLELGKDMLVIHH